MRIYNVMRKCYKLCQRPVSPPLERPAWPSVSTSHSRLHSKILSQNKLNIKFKKANCNPKNFSKYIFEYEYILPHRTHTELVLYRNENLDTKRYMNLNGKITDIYILISVYFSTIFGHFIMGEKNNTTTKPRLLTLLAPLHQVKCFQYTEEDNFGETNPSVDAAHHGTFLPSLSKYPSWTEEMT